MNKALQQIVDVKFQNYDAYRDDSAPTKRKPITNWLPESYKERFDNLQKETKCRFGKDIQEMIMRAIDLAEKAS